MRTFLNCLFASVLLNLAGCGYQQPETPDDKLVARQNPSPKQGYRITVAFPDAPGPFAVAKAKALYGPDITDPGCHNDPTALAPKSAGWQFIPLQLTRHSATEYSTVVYLDRFQDEDYYGRGVCHWKQTELRFSFMATGAAGETEFATYILGPKNFPSQQTLVTYADKSAYPRFQGDNPPNSFSNGEAIPENEWQVKSDPTDKSRFLTTFTQEKLTP